MPRYDCEYLQKWDLYCEVLDRSIFDSDCAHCQDYERREDEE